MSLVAVELRCEQNPSRLLGKMLRDPTVKIVEGNLVEIACDHCKADLRRGGDSCKRVLHRFDVLGDLIETEVIR